MPDLLLSLMGKGCSVPDKERVEVLPLQIVKILPDVVEGALSDIQALGWRGSLALVADANTWTALGSRVFDVFSPEYHLVKIVLPDGVKADQAVVEAIRAQAEKVNAFLAVGSGTVNDLVKAASFQEGKPYAVFGTAPSMNGYLSANASLTIEGHKHTIPAQLPVAAFMDLAVMAAAPKRLIRSGLGDSLCRSTAQVDWLMSHLLLDTAYDALPFQLLAPFEEALFASAGALMAGDEAAMALLVRTLLLSGVGMTLAGGSYPASQGEHLIAHATEMAGCGGDAFHGEQIGVTTLEMARMQRRWLGTGVGSAVFRDSPPPGASAPTSPLKGEVSLIAFFGEDVGAECARIWEAKRLKGEHLQHVNHVLKTKWPEIREQLRSVSVPVERLEAVLRDAGAPVRYDAIGWQRRMFEQAIAYAPCIRDRFTFLDWEWYF